MKLRFFLVFLVLAIPLNAQIGGVEANKALRATVQKWISVMKEIQLKKKEWQDKKEILQNSNEALQAEATQLEAEILSAVERQKKLDTQSENSLAQKKTYDDARLALRNGLDQLDEKVSAVIPLLPEQLVNEGKIQKAITDHQGFVGRNDKDEIALNARLTPMITILLEAEKFNQVVTPFEGLTADLGDKKVILDGIYFGLAMGFASDLEGNVAYHLKPGPEGWDKQKISDPETVIKTRELIDVGKGDSDLRLIDLPIEIAK